MAVKESCKHGWKFDIPLVYAWLSLLFMNSHLITKEKKSVFVTCLKEGTQINATTLRDLSLKRYLESY